MSKIQLISDILKSRERLRQRGVLYPRIQDIAVELGEQEEEVVLAIASNRPIRSLDGSYPRSFRGKASDMGEDDAIPLEMLADESAESPDEAVSRQDLREKIARTVASLPPREAEILRLYFGLEVQEPMTLDQIGARFRLTRERIRQLKEAALQRLRNPASVAFLASLLGDNDTALVGSAAERGAVYVAAHQKKPSASEGSGSLGVYKHRKHRRTSARR